MYVQRVLVSNLSPTDIIPQTDCGSLVIQEDADGATTKFSVGSPTISQGPATFGAGIACSIFKKRFGRYKGGTKIGQIQAVDAPAFFYITEED